MAMRIFEHSPMRERRWLWVVALLLSLALATSGCSQIKAWWSPDDDSTDLDDAANANEGEPLPPPVANVAISYRHSGDALARATVIKFFGAEVIANHQRDATRTESVVRFDGGVPIWEFKADEGTFGSLTVFQIERVSGSTSYQAVKVLADGSLQAYNAQPRAGSSYMLCCNVTSDFPEPVILPDTTPQDAGTANPPPDESPDQSATPPEESAPAPEEPSSPPSLGPSLLNGTP
jgi:hypothetical protein